MTGKPSRISRVVSALSIGMLAVATAALAVAWLANWKLDVIATGSMTPTAPTHSVAVVSPVTAQRVQRLDVIAFHDSENRAKEIVHRVVKVIHAPGGLLFFQTQGDANATPDARLVASTDVVGKLRWDVPRLGGIIGGLKPPVGYVVLLAPPFVYLVLGEVLDQRRKRRLQSATP